MIEHIASIFPAAARDIASTIIAESYDKGGSALISIAAVTTLWAASVGIHSLSKGIDRIYNSDKPNSIIKLRLKSMVYTLAVFAVMIFWLGLIVFGDTVSKGIIREFPKLSPIVKVLSSMHGIWAFLVLTLFFLAMYTVIPSKKVRFIAQIPGALISGVGCWGISMFFTQYYTSVLGFSPVYGGLTILVFFMLWLFFCLYALFIGAEVNKCMGERLDAEI